MCDREILNEGIPGPSIINSRPIEDEEDGPSNNNSRPIQTQNVCLTSVSKEMKERKATPDQVYAPFQKLNYGIKRAGVERRGSVPFLWTPLRNYKLKLRYWQEE